MNDAIVLLSGGLDSATTLALTLDQGASCHCISFDYGQRHAFELQAAGAIARSLRAHSHRVVKLDASVFRGSALTDGVDCAPKDRAPEQMAEGIPVTYVPARNLVFLSFAVACAESIGAERVLFGANAIDYSGYPDCRPEFVESFERTANLATKKGVEGQEISIEAPLIGMTKAEIIRLGTSLGVDYGLTHSCYDPGADGASCGRCDACTLRRRGFQEARIPDPTRYGATA